MFIWRSVEVSEAGLEVKKKKKSKYIKKKGLRIGMEKSLYQYTENFQNKTECLWTDPSKTLY